MKEEEAGKEMAGGCLHPQEATEPVGCSNLLIPAALSGATLGLPCSLQDVTVAV